jgi:M6 family metalloprotease-like protein
MKRYIFLVLIIISLFSTFLYSYEFNLNISNLVSEDSNHLFKLDDGNLFKLDDTNKATVLKKTNLKENNILKEDIYCSGYICLAPGETFESVATLSSTRDIYDYTQSTVDNKMGTAPTIGTYSIPVLLVKFSDMVAPSNLTQEIYDDVFNSSNYLDGEGISVGEFYKHNSYDQLNITYDVYDWREVPESYDYYKASHINTFYFIQDTLNLFGTGPDAIDFTQYDSDNDGRLDGVIIIHAGLPGQQVPGHMPSQAQPFVSNDNFYIQGKKYGNVAITASRNGETRCNQWINRFNYPSDCRTDVAVNVHEFAHVLGLPDLYAINYNGVQVGSGLGGHTVMVQNSDLGGSSQDAKKPVNFDMWSKFFFGWITPTVIDSAEQANIYSLDAYDTNPDVYLLRNPETMNDREFFLVTNRYISDTSLDRYLFGWRHPALPPITYNVHGGLDIFHVDENYIDYTYRGPIAMNSIMYDPDGDYYDDTVSHPGIVFEQNVLDTAFARQQYDLYTSEDFNLTSSCDPIVFEGKFDNIERHSIPESCSVIRDTTSTTYNGLVDSGIRVYGWSDSGEVIQAYLTVDEPLDLTAEIITPDSINYALEESIEFIGSYENNIGDVQCYWFYNQIDDFNRILLNNECSFSATPSSLGFQEGEYIITFVVEDEFLREAEDTITINFYQLSNLSITLLSPENNLIYYPDDTLYFSAEFENNIGETSCLWRKYAILEGLSTISTSCEPFTKTTQELGLLTNPHNGTYVFIFTIEDQLSRVEHAMVMGHYSENKNLSKNNSVNVKTNSVLEKTNEKKENNDFSLEVLNDFVQEKNILEKDKILEKELNENNLSKKDLNENNLSKKDLNVQKKQNTDFVFVYNNSSRNISCVWKYNQEIVSTDCDFNFNLNNFSQKLNNTFKQPGSCNYKTFTLVTTNNFNGYSTTNDFNVCLD